MVKNVELYHLAPNSTILMQCEVIKTRNDKIIVIDGGFYSKDHCYYIHSAIRAILGLKENDYFEVEAWFLTHCHGDHYGEMALQFERYGKDSNFKVNNIYFDFADEEKMDYHDIEEQSKYYEWKNAFISSLDNYAKECGIKVNGKRYFDDLNGAVINEKAVKDGLTFNIDGVEFEVLQTYHKDDHLVNGSSVVMKMNVYNEDNTMVEQSVMFLGDSSEDSGERLLTTVPNEKLKCDIVQMAHHGNWAVKKSVYDAIGAKVHLWPTPLWLWVSDETSIYDIYKVREWVGTTEPDEYNFVSSCYKNYPKDRESVEEWKEVLGQMKLVLPYRPWQKNKD